MPRRPKVTQDSPADVEQAYYDALNHADLESLMRLWADDEDVVCVHPGAPRLLGLTAIRDSWEQIFSRGPVLMRPTQTHAVLGMMTAVYNVIEQIISDEANQQNIHIIATNVYAKTVHGWKMVAHHASIAPGLPQDMAGESKTVFH